MDQPQQRFPRRCIALGGGQLEADVIGHHGEYRGSRAQLLGIVAVANVEHCREQFAETVRVIRIDAQLTADSQQSAECGHLIVDARRGGDFLLTQPRFEAVEHPAIGCGQTLFVRTRAATRRASP